MFILGLVVGLVVGFVIGILVGRKNPQHVAAAVQGAAAIEQKAASEVAQKLGGK